MREVDPSMDTIPTDENVQMLLAMGFPSESEVRRALKMAKNDMNEAVDMLTNGQTLNVFDSQLSPGANSQDTSVSLFNTLLYRISWTLLPKLQDQLFDLVRDKQKQF